MRRGRERRKRAGNRVEVEKRRLLGRKEDVLHFEKWVEVRLGKGGGPHNRELCTPWLYGGTTTWNYPRRKQVYT